MSKEPENKPKNWADDFSSEDDGDDEDDEYEDEPEQDGEQSNESQEVVGNSRNNRSSVDPPRAFVGSIHFGASEEEICTFFESRNCKIANIVLHQHADGKPKGSVVIEFADEESLNICLDLNGEKLRGMSIKTKLVEQHHGNKQQQQQHAGHRTSRYDNVAPNDYYSNRPPAGARHVFAPNAPYRGGGSRHDVQNDPQRPRQVNAHNEPYKGGGSRQNYGHNESYRGVDSRQDYGPNEQYRGVGSRAGYVPNEPYRGDGSRYDDVPNEPYRPRRVNVYNEPYRGAGSRQDYEPYRVSGSRQDYTQSGPYRGAGSRQDYGPNEPPYRGGGSRQDYGPNEPPYRGVGSQDYGPNEPFRAGGSRQDYGPNGSYRGSGGSRQDYVQSEPYRSAGSRQDYGPNEPPYREGPRHDSEPYRQDNEQYRGGRQDTEQYRGGRQNPEQYRRGGGGQYRHDNFGPNEGYAGGRNPGGGARYDGNARPYPDKNGPGFDSHDRDSGKGGRVNRRQPSEEVPNKPLPEVHPEAAAVTGTRPQLNIQPRSIPADGSRQTAANPDIFGGGKAHDDKNEKQKQVASDVPVQHAGNGTVFNLNAASDSTVGQEATDEGGVTDRKKAEGGFKTNKSPKKEGYKGHAKEGYNNNNNRGNPSREGYKGQGHYKGPYKGGQGYNKHVSQEGQYDQDVSVAGKIVDKDEQDPDEGRVTAAYPLDGPPPREGGSRDYVNEGYKKGYYKEGYSNNNNNRDDQSREGYKGQGYYKGPYKGQGYNKEDGYSKEHPKAKPKPITEKKSPVVPRTDENARAKILEILNVPTTSYIIHEPLENTPDEEAVDDYAQRPPQGDGTKQRANYNGQPKPRGGNKEPYTTRPQDVGNEGYGRGRQVRVTRDQYPPRSIKPDRAHHNAPEEQQDERTGGWGGDMEWIPQTAPDIPVESSHGGSSNDPSEPPTVSEHDGGTGTATSRYNGRQQNTMGLHGSGVGRDRDNPNKGRSVFGSVVKSHLVQENKQKAPVAVNYKQGTPFPKTNEQLFHDAQKKISDKNDRSYTIGQVKSKTINSFTALNNSDSEDD